jgi:hypothetical protein
LTKDGDKIPVFLGTNDSTENNLLTAIAELEKDSSLEPKEMASPSGNPIVTALVVKFATLAIKRWLENRDK